MAPAREGRKGAGEAAVSDPEFRFSACERYALAGELTRSSGFTISAKWQAVG